MERRSYALSTGVFVIALVLVAGIAFWWLGRADVEYQPYDVVSEYNIGGLTPHSTVYLRGVAVGKVESIRFDPENQRYIRIRINVDSTVQLTENVYATLRNQGVTGLSQIMLDVDALSADGQAAILVTSDTNPAEIAMRQGLLDRIMSQGEELIDDASKAMNNLAMITSDDNTQKITQLLDNLNTASTEFIALEREVAGLPTQAKSTLTETESFIANLNGLNVKIDRLVKNADIMAKRSAILIEEIDATAMPRIYESLDDISLAAKDVRRLAQSLDQNPQALIFGGEEIAPGPGEPGYQ